MYEVLVAIDRNADRAKRQANAVADLPGAGESVRAIVAHSFTENPTGATIKQLASAKRTQEILEDAGIEVELAETSGDPADSLLALAEDRDVDAICVGGRSRTPTGKVLFGSTSQAVVLGTDRPVLLCGADSE